MKRWIYSLALWCYLILLCLPPIGQVAAAGPSPDAEAELLPFDYARIWQEPVAVYASPGDPATMTPIDTLLPPDSWVSIDEVVEQDGRQWYRIGEQAYVLADAVQTEAPSLFHGMAITQPLTYPLVYIATQGLNVRARPGAAADNPPIATLNRYETEDFLGSQRAGDALWHQIGENRWIHGAYARVVFPVQRPEGVPADARWIAVDLAQPRARLNIARPRTAAAAAGRAQPFPSRGP